MVGQDVVTCTGTAAFASPQVGAGKTVTVSGLTLGGTDAGKYALASTTATTTASITVATVTPHVVVADKAYRRTTDAAIALCTLSGVISPDSVRCDGGTATFDTASVGPGKTVTVTGLALAGSAAGNYVLPGSTTTTATILEVAAIEPVTVTASLTVADKPYNGTNSATLTCTPVGVITGDDVQCVGNAAFDTISVGTGKVVTVTGLILTGTQSGNYVLSDPRRRRQPRRSLSLS